MASVEPPLRYILVSSCGIVVSWIMETFTQPTPTVDSGGIFTMGGDEPWIMTPLHIFVVGGVVLVEVL